MTAQWYIIHAYSGFEDKVAQTIRDQARIHGLEGDIEQVMVPKEEVIEVKRGQKKKIERNFFPGYVLAKMNMSEQAYHFVKNTPKVTGFLGPQGKPQAISEVEAKRILSQVEEGVERPRATIAFEVGEEVKVIDGPFTSFNGMVEEVDEDRQRVKVSVSIFGRPTPVELEYGQVQKN